MATDQPSTNEAEMAAIAAIAGTATDEPVLMLDLPSAPGGRENFRLRRECVEYAVIHRLCGELAVDLAPDT